jgi:polysaccharide export outer membrane protein
MTIKDMNRPSNFILIFISLCFLILPLVVFAQEKVDARVEARQHYLKGKEYYSQGLYEEAGEEFNQAIELLSTSRFAFKESIEKQASKGITPPDFKYGIKLETEKNKETKEAQALPPPHKKETTQITKKEEEALEKATPVLAAVQKEAPSSEEKEYYLGIGDVLDISVWKVPDLSRADVIIRPDGKLSFPLIGDINAEGLTLTQLDNTVTEKLKTYVKSPEVSVMIRRFGEQVSNYKVVILGEILSPGIYKFDAYPTITEAIASAGGYTKYAVLNSIIIIRGDIKTKPELIRTNVADILKTGDLSQNIVLKPNDIVYVPRSFIGKLNVFLELIQPALNEYFQTLNAKGLHNAVHRK